MSAADEGPPPRVLGALVGDVRRQPANRIKYGQLFDAVAARVDLVGVLDSGLHGWRRAMNAAVTAHPDRDRWKERFYKNPWAFEARSRALARHLRRRPVDVVLQLGTMFDPMRHQRAVPNLIYTDHTAALAARRPEGGRTPYPGRWGRRWAALEREAFHAAAGIAVRGHVVARSVVEDYGVSAERVHVVGGGVNLPALPPPVDRDPDREPTVLFIGAELRRKGGDMLLRAFARARRAVPAARLVLVTGERVPCGWPLEGVTVRPPTWDRTAVGELYRAADVFALPSRLETWGDVLLEAMAFGLPCVGVAGDAMGEIIDDRVTGAIVPAGDVEALSAVLVDLLRDQRLRSRWGAAGRDRVHGRFTWDHVAARLAPALRDAARARDV